MKVKLFHGQARYEDRMPPDSYDVVITTYDVMRSEFLRTHDPDEFVTRESSILYTTNWHRIILDEGRCSALLCR